MLRPSNQLGREQRCNVLAADDGSGAAGAHDRRQGESSNCRLRPGGSCSAPPSSAETFRRPSTAPNVTDAESQDCARRLNAWWYALLIHVGIDSREGIMTFGGRGKLEVEVPRIQVPDTAYRHRHAPLERITPSIVASAKDAADQLIEIHPVVLWLGSLASDEASEPSSAGAREAELDERLHQFVRTLDGILRLPANAGQAQFMHQCQVFASGHGIAELLRQMYRLRNSFEHLSRIKHSRSEASG